MRNKKMQPLAVFDIGRKHCLKEQENAKKCPLKKTSPKFKRKLSFPPKKLGLLNGKKFFLDLQGSSKATTVKDIIEQLGGTLEEFNSKEVYCIVTNRFTIDEIIQHRSQSKHGAPSPLSGPVPSPIFAPVPSPLQPLSSNKCYLNSPLSTDSPQTQQSLDTKGLSITRGKSLLSKAVNGTQRQGSSNLLQLAQKWGTKVLHLEQFLKWTKDKKVAEFLQPREKTSSTSGSSSSHGKNGTFRVKKLKSPFIKIEDKTRKYRPFFSELGEWPSIFFETNAGTCPFEKPTDKHAFAETNEQISDKETNEDGPSKSISEHASEKQQEKYPEPPAKLKEAKESARNGYCECCSVRFNDIAQHVKSDQHRTYARNDNNYSDLDSVIQQGFSFHEFLASVRDKYKAAAAHKKHEVSDNSSHGSDVVEEDDKKIVLSLSSDSMKALVDRELEQNQEKGIGNHVVSPQCNANAESTTKPEVNLKPAVTAKCNTKCELTGQQCLQNETSIGACNKGVIEDIDSNGICKEHVGDGGVVVKEMISHAVKSSAAHDVKVEDKSGVGTINEDACNEAIPLKLKSPPCGFPSKEEEEAGVCNVGIDEPEVARENVEAPAASENQAPKESCEKRSLECCTRPANDNEEYPGDESGNEVCSSPVKAKKRRLVALGEDSSSGSSESGSETDSLSSTRCTVGSSSICNADAGSPDGDTTPDLSRRDCHNACSFAEKENGTGIDVKDSIPGHFDLASDSVSLKVSAHQVSSTAVHTVSQLTGTVPGSKSQDVGANRCNVGPPVGNRTSNNPTKSNANSGDVNDLCVFSSPSSEMVLRNKVNGILCGLELSQEKNKEANDKQESASKCKKSLISSLIQIDGPGRHHEPDSHESTVFVTEEEAFNQCGAVHEPDSFRSPNFKDGSQSERNKTPATLQEPSNIRNASVEEVRDDVFVEETDAHQHGFGVHADDSATWVNPLPPVDGGVVHQQASAVNEATSPCIGQAVMENRVLKSLLLSSRRDSDCELLNDVSMFLDDDFRKGVTMHERLKMRKRNASTVARRDSYPTTPKQSREVDTRKTGQRKSRGHKEYDGPTCRVESTKRRPPASVKLADNEGSSSLEQSDDEEYVLATQRKRGRFFSTPANSSYSCHGSGGDEKKMSHMKRSRIKSHSSRRRQRKGSMTNSEATESPAKNVVDIEEKFCFHEQSSGAEEYAPRGCRRSRRFFSTPTRPSYKDCSEDEDQESPLRRNRKKSQPLTRNQRQPTSSPEDRPAQRCSETPRCGKDASFSLKLPSTSLFDSSGANRVSPEATSRAIRSQAHGDSASASFLDGTPASKPLSARRSCRIASAYDGRSYKGYFANSP